jgi:hypothetical protein
MAAADRPGNPVSRRLRKLEARLRELEAPVEAQARKRISEGLAAYDRLRKELVPVDVYQGGLVRRIEFATESELEADDQHGEKTA